MDDVNALEQRIAAALERIDAGIARQDEGGNDAAHAELSALREALDSERAASGQLEERIRSLHAREQEIKLGVEAELQSLRAQRDRAEAETLRLREVNAQLRSNNAALREANAAGLGDAGLINSGMVAELDALRASRAADRGELDAILTELKPLLEGRASA